MCNFKKCLICGKYDFMDDHECPPSWKVFHEEYLGDEFKEVYAYNAQNAAIKYAEYYDQDDYDILDGEEITVEVESLDGIVKKKFIITGQTVPEYQAEEI